MYDGRQQVLYWADVMSEIAFVVPSSESYNRYLADPNGGRDVLVIEFCLVPSVKRIH